MRSKSALLITVALATLAAAACSSSGSSSSSSGSGAGSDASTRPSADFVALGGWSDGACDATQPKVKVAITEPIEVAGVSLRDYVDGTQAAVDAFNGRGGIKGRCLGLTVCDGKADEPTETACARAEADDPDVVAGLVSTFLRSEATAYQLFESAGLPQIGAQVTQPGAWNSPVSYEFTMGGSGALLAGIPALKTTGVTKFAIILPENGQSAALRAFADPLIKALGMDLVDIIEVPATSVEYTQFVLSAQNAGAEGVVLALPQNVLALIVDAMSSVNSPLKASMSPSSPNVIATIPEQIATNAAYGDAIPPAATDRSRWPIFDVVLDDFKASGKSSLELDNLTSLATQGWLAVYSLVKVMRDWGATEITRATVKQAFDKASSVPMFDLIAPWTPSKQSTNAIFTGISNSNYWTMHWDGSTEQFVVDDEQVDILALLGS
jgi:ABC-type branched-subunit amino acid transport system substrate-binding protein